MLTGRGAVRYPDALITCSPFPDTDVVASDPVIVFEMVSPGSGRADRIDKVREHASVASIMRYVIVETADPGVLVLHRTNAGAAWTATALTLDDALDLPEVSASIPVGELYDGVSFQRAN